MNILAILTIAIVVGLTGFIIILVHKHEKKLSVFKGIIITMAVSIVTGLMSGYLVAIISGDLFAGGGIGLITGGIAGFLTGQPAGILGVLSGLPTGMMSGITGALFGVFLSIENPYIMLGILLVFYIIVIGFAILFIKVESSDSFHIDTRAISPYAVLGFGIVIVSLFLFLYSSNIIKLDVSSTSAQAQTTEAASASANSTGNNTAAVTKKVDVTKEKNPIIKMEVTTTGYSPNVIYVKKGVPFKLEIHNTLENSCLSTILIPGFNINTNLKVGTTTVIKITPTKTGEYDFTCGMHMYGGKIIVE